jgi:hypothetical protein
MTGWLTACLVVAAGLELTFERGDLDTGEFVLSLGTDEWGRIVGRGFRA